MNFDLHSWWLGFFAGCCSWIAVKIVWSEAKETYERRIEIRARALAATKFAEFAGIKK
jgi:hypothetical protein